LNKSKKEARKKKSIEDGINHNTNDGMPGEEWRAFILYATEMEVGGFIPS
jgi:hypothetical protein